MTTPTPESVKALADLADRVESATGPDRELDYWIMTRTVPTGRAYLWDPEDQNHRYTASLDAAMTLVPTGWDWSVSSYGEDGASAEAWEHGWKDDTTIHSFLAPTPPLCLVVALLRARAANLGASHD